MPQPTIERATLKQYLYVIIIMTLTIALSSLSFNIQSAETNEGSREPNIVEEYVQAEPANSSNSRAQQPSNANEGASTLEKDTEEIFIPSTQISEDLSVSFPVNI